jgi:hypothetical protein
MSNSTSKPNLVIIKAFNPNQSRAGHYGPIVESSGEFYSGPKNGRPKGFDDVPDYFWGWSHNKTLDLSKPADAWLYEMIKRHPSVAPSKEERSNFSQQTFYIYDESTESKKVIEDAKYVSEKISTIAEINSVSKINSVGLLLGIIIKNKAPEVIKSECIKLLTNDPQKFKQRFETKDSGMIILVRGAVEFGVVSVGVDGRYLYGGIVLGFSEADVVVFLRQKDNNEIANSIAAQIETNVAVKKYAVEPE